MYVKNVGKNEVVHSKKTLIVGKTLMCFLFHCYLEHLKGSIINLVIFWVEFSVEVTLFYAL